MKKNIIVNKYGGSMVFWDEFIDNSINGTIYHKLSFLKYHGDKYTKNEHNIIIKQGNKIIGMMPMGIFVDSSINVARSPFGASYGSIVYKSNPSYNDGIKIINAIKDYLQQIDVAEIYITLPITPVFKYYCDTFTLAMIHCGFELSNRQISSVIELGYADAEKFISSTRKRNIKKARRMGVKILRNANLNDFIVLLEKTFQKYNSKPTHTYDELKYLTSHFSNDIFFTIAQYKGKPIAGLCYIANNNRVITTFYIVSDPAFKSIQAMSLLIYDGIIENKKKGYKCLDLGTTGDSSFIRPNTSDLFRFKEGFGAVGRWRETYKLQLV